MSLGVAQLTGKRRGSVGPAPQSVWKAGWRVVGGKRFYARSKWEANFARYLEWLKQRSEIEEWEHEAQVFWFLSIKRGVRSYLPDFRVTELNGVVVFFEVKGWMDPKSKTKIKRMAKYHPTVKLTVINSKQYVSIAASVSGMIPGWE